MVSAICAGGASPSPTCRGANSPEIGKQSAAFCRDVEDAVPYDGMRRSTVGADIIRPRGTGWDDVPFFGEFAFSSFLP